MALLACLPDDATLRDVFATYPDQMLHLNGFAEALMRGPCPLSEGERELIAAYVSGLNACAYCHGVHAATATVFGVDEGLFTALLEGIDRAPVEAGLKPILRYVKKLTESPSRMTPADAEAVYAAGWDDRALFHAIAVCAYFNLMNRIVEGTGCSADESQLKDAGQRLASDGYMAMRRLIGANGG
jgi:uncharacterized peroxidase-related enzyme